MPPFQWASNATHQWPVTATLTSPKATCFIWLHWPFPPTTVSLTTLLVLFQPIAFRVNFQLLRLVPNIFYDLTLAHLCRLISCHLPCPYFHWPHRTFCSSNTLYTITLLHNSHGLCPPLGRSPRSSSLGGTMRLLYMPPLWMHLLKARRTSVQLSGSEQVPRKCRWRKQSARWHLGNVYSTRNVYLVSPCPLKTSPHNTPLLSPKPGSKYGTAPRDMGREKFGAGGEGGGTP